MKFYEDQSVLPYLYYIHFFMYGAGFFYMTLFLSAFSNAEKALNFYFS